MCALEALNKDYTYLVTDEAVTDKWGKTDADFRTHISKYESKKKIVSHVDRFRIRSGGFNVVGVRERHEH